MVAMMAMMAMVAMMAYSNKDAHGDTRYSQNPMTK